MTRAGNPFMTQCTATARTTGKQCNQWAIQGATVCRTHGGLAPQVRDKATRRLAAMHLQARVDKGLDGLLADLEIDAAGRGPTAVLLDVVHRSYAVVQVLGAIVGALTVPDPTAAPGGYPADALYDRALNGDGRPHVALALYEQWLDKAAKVAKMALDAGVSEKLVQIEQEKGRLVAQIIAAVIDSPDLGLSDDKRQIGRQIAATHLRMIETG